MAGKKSDLESAVGTYLNTIDSGNHSSKAQHAALQAVRDAVGNTFTAGDPAPDPVVVDVGKGEGE